MWEENWATPHVGAVARAIYATVTLTPYSQCHEFVLGPFLFIFFSVLFIVVSIILSLLYFGSHQRIGTFWAGLLFYEIQFFAAFVTYPAGHYLGLAIRELSASFTAIAFFLLTALLTVIPFSIRWFTFVWSGYLVSPDPSMIASVDGIFIGIGFAFGLVEVIITTATYHSPRWVRLIPLSIGVLGGFRSLHLVNQMQFLPIIADCVAGGVACSIIASDLLALIDYFAPVGEIARFVAPNAGLLIGFPIYKYIHIAAQQRILAALQAPELYGPDADAYIESLHIDDELTARKFFTVGIGGNAHSVYSGAFTFPLAAKLDTFHIWFYTTAVLAMIPSNDAVFRRALARLRESAGASALRQLFVVPLIELAERRSASDVFARKLEVLNTQTGYTILLTKQFWSDVAGETGNAAVAVKYLALAIETCQDRWDDLRSAYDDDPAILSAYSTFLVDCRADFALGGQLRRRALQPESIHSGPDPLFTLFCRSRPEVLRTGFVSLTGKLRDPGEFRPFVRSDSGSTSSMDDALEAPESDESEANRDEMAFWRATADHLPRHYELAVGVSTLTFAVWFLVILLSILTLNSHVSDYDSICSDIERLVETRVDLNYLRASLILVWAETSNLLFESEENFADAVINLGMVRSSLVSLAGHVLDGFSCMYALLEWNESNNMPFLLEDLCILENETTSSFIIETRDLSIARAIATLFWDVYEIQRIGSDILNATHFCHFNALLETVPAALTTMQEGLTSVIDKQNQSLRSEKYAQLIIELLLMFLVFLPIIAVPHFLLFRHINHLLLAIQELPQESVHEACVIPISLLDSEPKVRIPTHTSHTFAWQIIYVCGIVATIFLTAIPSYAVAQSGDEVLDIVALLQISGQRHPLALEMWNYMALLLVARTHPLSFIDPQTLLDRFQSTTDLLMECDDDYIVALEEVIDVYPAITAAQSAGDCDSIVCWDEVPGLSDFYDIGFSLLDSPSVGISSSDFGNFTEQLFLRIDPALRVVRAQNLALCDSIFNRTFVVSLILTLLAAFILILVFLIDRLFHTQMVSVLRTMIELLRHIPPSAVANCPELVAVFLAQEPVESDQSVAQVVFERSLIPVVVIGEQLVIECINSAFAAEYDIRADNAIGHPLETIVPPPPASSVSTWNDGDLYGGLRHLLLQDSGQAKATAKLLVTGHPIPVSLRAFAIPKRALVVIFLMNRNELESQEANHEALTRHVQVLVRQQMPKHEPLPIANAVIIAVEISACFNMIETHFRELDTVFLSIEGLVRRYAGFHIWTMLCNTVYLAGGLSADGEDLRAVAVALALEIADEIGKKISPRQGGKFRIAIANGPALRMVIGGDLQLGTETVDVVEEMIAALSHPDEVIAGWTFRAVIGARQDISVADGPVVQGLQTIVIAPRQRKRVG